MTPFSLHLDRTATISLTKQQEEIVRKGYDPANIFQVQLVTTILEKLHGSLRTSDTLLGPAGHTIKPKAPDPTINLDLLEL